MLQLVTGLVLFFGMHASSIVALPLRDALAAKSELGWKAVYSVISLAGLILHRAATHTNGAVRCTCLALPCCRVAVAARIHAADRSVFPGTNIQSSGASAARRGKTLGRVAPVGQRHAGGRAAVWLFPRLGGRGSHLHEAPGRPKDSGSGRSGEKRHYCHCAGTCLVRCVRHLGASEPVRRAAIHAVALQADSADQKKARYRPLSCIVAAVSLEN